MKLLEYGIESYTAIVGNNPENADMSNPAGHIYGEVYYATAETPDGQIFGYCHTHLNEDDAIADAIFCEEQGIPVTDKDFEFHRHRYGSPSYQVNYIEAEGALSDDLF